MAWSRLETTTASFLFCICLLRIRQYLHFSLTASHKLLSSCLPEISALREFLALSSSWHMLIRLSEAIANPGASRNRPLLHRSGEGHRKSLLIIAGPWRRLSSLTVGVWTRLVNEIRRWSRCRRHLNPGRVCHSGQHSKEVKRTNL
jgi:hypothetical protein